MYTGTMRTYPRRVTKGSVRARATWKNEALTTPRHALSVSTAREKSTDARPFQCRQRGTRKEHGEKNSSSTPIIIGVTIPTASRFEFRTDAYAAANKKPTQGMPATRASVDRQTDSSAVTDETNTDSSDRARIFHHNSQNLKNTKFTGWNYRDFESHVSSKRPYIYIREIFLVRGLTITTSGHNHLILVYLRNS